MEHVTEELEPTGGRISRRSVLGGLMAVLVAPTLLAKARAGTGSPLRRSRALKFLTPPTPSAALPRFGHSATPLADGRILVIGGWRYSGTSALNPPLASVQIYDPSGDVWTNAAPLKTARAEHAAVALPDGRVLVTGGLGHAALADAEIYDPARDVWTPTASMGQPRYGHAATVSDGRVIVTGGCAQLPQATVLAYDIAGGVWQRAR